MVLEPEQVEALNRLRVNLVQVVAALGTVKQDLEQSAPLPKWSDLQRDADLTLQHITNYQRTMTAHREFLQSAHAYPLTSFPGHDKEMVLGMVMRKKLEPRVEDWVARYSAPRPPGQANGSSHGHGGDRMVVDGGEDAGGAGGNRLQSAEYRDLWEWASRTGNAVAMEFVDALEDNYTLAEREQGIENVVTGLRRNLDFDSDEEDEDDKDEERDEGKMDVDVDVDVTPGKNPPSTSSGEKKVEKGVDPTLPPLSLEAMLKFMTTGQWPSGHQR